MKIKILHLYPDLLNLYGDKGNIAALTHRLIWRGIDAEVVNCTLDNEYFDLSDVDIVFLGGGSDREEKIVCEKLCANSAALRDYAKNNGVILAVCGGFPMLGKQIKTADGIIEGAGVLDICTEPLKERLIGDVVMNVECINSKVVGFVNHGTAVNIGNHTPLGTVVYGYGNTGEKGVDGVMYKNVFASFLHGPLLPKNPQLCDYILTCALKKRYTDFAELSPLDDTAENTANEYIVSRYIK